MRNDLLPVLLTPLLVYPALLLLSIFDEFLVSFLIEPVLISAILDHVGKLRVLVGNSYLLLQPKLLIVQLADPVFHHLGLHC